MVLLDCVKQKCYHKLQIQKFKHKNLLLISLLGHLSTGKKLKRCCALTEKKVDKWGLRKDRAIPLQAMRAVDV